MAAGEAEGGMVLVEVPRDFDFIVDIAGQGQSDLTIDMYRMATVRLEGGGEVPDPLIPFDPKIAIKGNVAELFYVKMITSSGCKPGKYTRDVKFVGLTGQESATLQIEVEVFPVQLSAQTKEIIQATVLPLSDFRGNERTNEMMNMRKCLAFLRGYHINGIAGLWTGGEAAAPKTSGTNYIQLVEYALDDLEYKRVRLPAKQIYSWNHPMSGKNRLNKASEQDLAAGFRQHLKQFIPMIDNPRRTGMFSFKIWDEPRDKDYSDVVSSYRAAREAVPRLKLELSEQPEPALQGVADVWTPHIRFINKDLVNHQHQLGKEVWCYANRVHGIDHPLHGMRILGWVLWRYNLDGYLFWAINWWKEDPWTIVSSESVDYLKRGMLLYPAKTGTGIWPSLRLEEFREGIEDMQLLKMLEGLNSRHGGKIKEVEDFISRLSSAYPAAERYDNAENPARFKRVILEFLAKYQR
jgi:hypothetical protein